MIIVEPENKQMSEKNNCKFIEMKQISLPFISVAIEVEM